MHDHDEGSGCSGSFVLWLVLCAGALVAVAAPAVVEELERSCCRRPGNDTGAIGALKTIGTAQSLFREADKEGDGNLDYGTLEELANCGATGLIDSVLGSGTKNGYLFEATYGASTSEFIWIATARPALPGTTGDRYFVTNHEGVTFYTTEAPFQLNTVDCTIPASARAVGK